VRTGQGALHTSNEANLTKQTRFTLRTRTMKWLGWSVVFWLLFAKLLLHVHTLSESFAVTALTLALYCALTRWAERNHAQWVWARHCGPLRLLRAFMSVPAPDVGADSTGKTNSLRNRTSRRWMSRLRHRFHSVDKRDVFDCSLRRRSSVCPCCEISTWRSVWCQLRASHANGAWPTASTWLSFRVVCTACSIR